MLNVSITVSDNRKQLTIDGSLELLGQLVSTFNMPTKSLQLAGERESQCTPLQQPTPAAQAA